MKRNTKLPPKILTNMFRSVFSVAARNFMGKTRSRNWNVDNLTKHLHLSFSSGSCRAGVLDKLWWWWWWFDVSCDKWFKLLLPDDISPVIADDTLTADDTESCKLWWLCKWSFAFPLLVLADTKSCRHKPCASDILWIPRSIFSDWLFLLYFGNPEKWERKRNKWQSLR